MEVDLLAPLSFPPGPKPREAAEWLRRFETETDLRDHMHRILEEQSPAVQFARKYVGKYVAAEILPALQSGSALVKKRSDIEDVFSPKCDLCEKFLAALGGEVPSEKLDTTTSPVAALNFMLSKAATHEPSVAKSDQERLKTLLEAGGCQSEAMAELVLERLQAHMQALRVGIDDCRALGDPEKPYEDASADAANLHAALRNGTARRCRDTPSTPVGCSRVAPSHWPVSHHTRARGSSDSPQTRVRTRTRSFYLVSAFWLLRAALDLEAVQMQSEELHTSIVHGSDRKRYGAAHESVRRACWRLPTRPPDGPPRLIGPLRWASLSASKSARATRAWDESIHDSPSARPAFWSLSSISVNLRAVMPRRSLPAMPLGTTTCAKRPAWAVPSHSTTCSAVHSCTGVLSYE